MMGSIRGHRIALLAVVVALGGCPQKLKRAAPGETSPTSQPATPPTAAGGKVIATVNGARVYHDDLSFWLRGGHGMATVTKTMVQKTREKIIEAELVYQHGIKLGLHKDRRYQQKLRKMELQLRAYQRREMLRRVKNVAASGVKMDSGQSKAYFKQHQQQIQREYHLQAARFRRLSAAQGAWAGLNAGTLKFEQLLGSATQGHGSAPQASDLGFVPWLRMPLEWAEAVAALKPGQITRPIAGRAGIAILRLVASREGAAISYEQAEGALMNRMRDKATNDAYQKLLGELRAKARIELKD